MFVREAELGIQQISEIRPVKGVIFAGPLSDDLQNYTAYAAAVASASFKRAPAEAFIELLSSAEGIAKMRENGLQPQP